VIVTFGGKPVRIREYVPKEGVEGQQPEIASLLVCVFSNRGASVIVMNRGGVG
jgi:hypothetical protein